jgi:tRNA(adenine34) deaminase
LDRVSASEAEGCAFKSRRAHIFSEAADAATAVAPAERGPGSADGLRDRDYLRRAIELAAQAERAGDVPIGAVLVCGGLVVEAKNEKEARPDPTAHAEILAIRAAARELGTWRLSGSTLFVTKEPCLMCAGAIVAARIERLVFAAYDPKGGAAGSVVDAFSLPSVNHRVSVVGGILEEEASRQLRAFFERRRGKEDRCAR